MTEVKNYHPAFDILFDCLSSNKADVRERLEKYVAHRKLHGREAAKRIYPDCHNIQIEDPQLKDMWKTFLKTLDSLGKK